MLGFCGRFSTKSRTYSTPLSALRADRATYRREQAIAAEVLPELDHQTNLVVANWRFAAASARRPSR